MNVRAALAWASAELAGAGIAGPRREARLLLAHCLALPPGAMPDPAAPVEGQAFADAVRRRVAREPFAFITRRQGFWSLDLAVSPATLIPRADSETLITAALAAFPARQAVRRVLDLGTGTGCLLLAALAEFPAATGIGTDRSAAAAALAARNAAANGLAGRASLVVADWAAPLAGHFDVILSNPPYIRRQDMAGLMPEVRLHEPASALDGGPDGLREYARLMPDVARLLAPEGAAILELGESQADAVGALAAAAGLRVEATRNDLGGIARACVLRQRDRPAPAWSAAAKKPFGSTFVGR